MKHGMFSIKDTATGTYSQPFVAQTNNLAMRQFGDLATDKTTNINKHPSDFCLVRVGEWNEDEGRLTDEENTTLAWAGDFHEPSG